MATNIRNICTIAHVDHGKTTLVDFLFRQSGTFKAHQDVGERVMDSDDLEREKGITILAKNASFHLGDTKINIVDTPGHADFGGEVERIMGMVDGAILLVDALEGPMPQTRFVLQNAIKKGLKIILCVNKVDRPEVQHGDAIQQCVDKTFDLFVELGANDEQCDFPIVYACAREGWCTEDPDQVPAIMAGEGPRNLEALLKLILKLPPPRTRSGASLQMLVSNVLYSDYVGFMALGKILAGSIKRGAPVIRHGIDETTGAAKRENFMAARLYSFVGMEQKEVQELNVGDIGLITGCENFKIGDTLAGDDAVEVLERIEVESPTMQMIFSINTSPFSGTEGTAIQSRQLFERLRNEVYGNPSLRLEPTDKNDQFSLLGRGELQFAILVEKMRREGLEFMIGRPVVVYKYEDGVRKEPIERVTLDLPECYSGDVTRLLQGRRGVLMMYENLNLAGKEPWVRLIFEIPTRGLIGIQSRYLTVTRGSGVISHELIGYKEHCGVIANRTSGSLIADRTGETTAYALNQIQERGVLFIGEGVTVYEGMIIGENAKDVDLNVNAVRGKKLTNIRTTASDGIVILQGIRKLSLEACIEWIDDDEWIEVTPKSIRLRKKVLASNMRSVRKEDRLKDS
jgi:GTP-binding protein